MKFDINKYIEALMAVAFTILAAMLLILCWKVAVAV